MILKYMIGCSLILIILAIAGFWASKNRKPIAVPLKCIMFSACIPVACQMILTVSTSEFLSKVIYSVFFVSIEVVLYYFLLFTYEYTRTQRSKAKYILYGLMGMDIMSIILNIFTGHVGECVLRHYSDQNKPYYGMDYRWGYYCHLAVSYVIVVLIMIIMIRKIVMTVRIYWIQYFTVLGSLLVVVLWNVVYALFGGEVDFSVLGYAIAGIMLFYFSLYFKPRMVINSLLTAVIGNLQNGILCFDIDDNCIYVNEQMKKIFDTGDTESVLRSFRKLVEKCNLDITKDETYVIDEFTVKDRIYYLELQFQRLRFKDGKVIGTFYELTDRTKEMAETKRHVYLSTHDDLTGLHNERWLYRKINLFLRHAPGKDYLVIVYDILNFKVFNDNFGREKGDEVLRMLANTLQSIEEFDSESMTARLSGGKFVIFISKEAYNQTQLGERIEEMEFLLENASYPVYVHAGIYDISLFGAVSADSMIDRATFALASINQMMGSRIVFYDANMKDELVWNQTISAELDQALESKQIYLCIQPQVDSEGRILGGEALVRWNHPVHGLLVPDRFLPVFEKNGLINRLDVFMWHSAARLVRKWEKQGIKGFISVNISPVDIDLMDVYEVFTGIVKTYGINPKHLNLEITETMVSRNIKQNIHLIERLKKFGFSVEMDDFGSGYSSLNMLKDIPVDIIKLDMKFLQDAENGERSKEIMKFIFDMTKSLHITTIAEGVEDSNHMDILRKMGCDIYQGYYFSPPLMVEDFERKYYGRVVEEQNE